MGSETALVGPWTVLAFSRYFDEMDGAYHTGAYNTATMALARYFPIAIAAYIVSIRIRDDQLPMFAAIGICLFYSANPAVLQVPPFNRPPIYGPGFEVGAYGNNRREFFRRGWYYVRNHLDFIRRHYRRP